MNMKSNFEMKSEMFTIKAQRVLSVEEVAKIFKVEPKEIVELVEQYSDRFPHGYSYRVKNDKRDDLMFSEKGMYMLSALVKSPIAKEKCLDMIESYKVLMDLADEMVNALQHVREEDGKKEGHELKVISVSSNENEASEEFDIVDENIDKQNHTQKES